LSIGELPPLRTSFLARWSSIICVALRDSIIATSKDALYRDDASGVDQNVANRPRKLTAFGTT